MKNQSAGKWEEIGEFAVDSGMFLICDPCYIHREIFRDEIEKRISDMNEDRNISNICLSFPDSETRGLGVIGTTIIGDGAFSVHQKISKKTGQKQVRITFSC